MQVWLIRSDAKKQGQRRSLFSRGSQREEIHSSTQTNLPSFFLHPSPLDYAHHCACVTEIKADATYAKLQNHPEPNRPRKQPDQEGSAYADETESVGRFAFALLPH